MTVTASYQTGHIALVKRRKGPAVWVLRWRETATTGKQRHRAITLGNKQKYPRRADAGSRIIWQVELAQTPSPMILEFDCIPIFLCACLLLGIMNDRTQSRFELRGTAWVKLIAEPQMG